MTKRFAVAPAVVVMALGGGWSAGPTSKGPPPCREAALVSLRTARVLKRFSARVSAVGPGYDTGPLIPGSDAVPDGRGGWLVAGIGLGRLRNDGRIDHAWHAPLARRLILSGLVRVRRVVFVHDRYYAFAFDALTGRRLWRSAKVGAKPRSAGILSLAASPSAVYVGGDFGRVGGINRSALAALDARTGRLLPWRGPTLVSYDEPPSVGSLALTRTRLYFSGIFDAVAGVPRMAAVAAARLRDGTPASFSPRVRIRGFTALAVSGRRILIGGPEGGGVFDAEDSRRLRGSTVVSRASAIFIRRSTVYLGGGGKDYLKPHNLASIDVTTGERKRWSPNLARYVYTAAVLGVVRGKVFVGGQFCRTLG